MKFKVGDLVRWYRYSHDMIIIDGGIGCIIGFKKYKYGGFDVFSFEVLCSDGKVEDFDPSSLDIA